MTKRKGVISKVFVVLVVLTLLSCCFLGSTFARYTSGGTGTATVQVAKWDVKNTQGSMDVSFTKLSPDDAEYGSVGKREHGTGKVKVAAILNSGDVNADVTLFAEDEDEIITCGAAYGDGIAIDDAGTITQAPSEENVKSLFSVVLYYTDDDTNGVKSNFTTYDLSADESPVIELTPGKAVYIYAEVFWTTNESINSDAGLTADALDTWVGQYVSSVTYTISYRAVQGSELPGA